MNDDSIDRGREFLRDTVRLQFDFSTTDQNRGLPPPPVVKPAPPGAARIALPQGPVWGAIDRIELQNAIARRRSRRRFGTEPLSADELSFLLWATQGVRASGAGGPVFRTVPSAGNRHALETYVFAFRVEGLAPAVYRYLPVGHQLLLEFEEPRAAPLLAEAALDQAFVGQAAATFVWTAVPYRMEWRYGAASHKVIALDAGHVCQNLYLACEAIGAGTCAVAAYHQHKLDALLRVDGRDEFAVYLAPVGKL